MNLLKDGIENGYVIDSGMKTKMTVDGLTDTYVVYRVKIDYLYFNDQNDRISTWISQYKEENNVKDINKSNIENYNNIIQQFITDSNPDRLKQTEANIELLGQQKYGVVLNDGRIIDGNRRFCCLRNLSKNDQKFSWFETVILNKDYENNAKQIKMLELQIQIGEDARVDYNPIDRLVGVYRDVVQDKLLSIQEYANSTNQKINDVKKEVEISKLLVEFLDSINASGKYYIARDMDLNGPLYELYGILNKTKDEDKKNQIKYNVFCNLVSQPAGDMTRFIRNLKYVVNSNYFYEFIEKEEPVVEKVLDQLSTKKDVDKSVINEIRADEEIKNNLQSTMEIVSNKAKMDDTKSKPLQNLTKAFDAINVIDNGIVSRLNEEQRDDIVEQIESIKQKLDEILEAINV